MYIGKPSQKRRFVSLCKMITCAPPAPRRRPDRNLFAAIENQCGSIEPISCVCLDISRCENWTEEKKTVLKLEGIDLILTDVQEKKGKYFIYSEQIENVWFLPPLNMNSSLNFLMSHLKGTLLSQSFSLSVNAPLQWTNIYPPKMLTVERQKTKTKKNITLLFVKVHKKRHSNLMFPVFAGSFVLIK